jgi:hypothetical protein
MPSALTLSVITFALIVLGTFVGALLRNLLPEHHLADDSKDIVRLGSALIATISALVLSLLISSAKSSYDTQSGQVRQLTANVVLLDQLLAVYGPETRAIRELLRPAAASMANRIWREGSSDAAQKTPFEASVAGELAFAKVEELSPQTDFQRSLKTRAVQLTTDLAQTRLSLFEQAGSAIPLPFLAVLVFWLMIIFGSFSLFSRLNPTAIVALLLFGLSATGAIFLILEMNQPFTGLMQISSAPLRNALAPLESGH